MRTLRVGLGPVFAYEWLKASRRWQLYAGRSLFVGLLLAGLVLSWNSLVRGRSGIHFRELATIGESCFQTIMMIQLALVLLVAPAATAGAICLDKARGSLIHLLVTDLSNAEIVLGKLAARLLPVLGLLAAGAPVMFVCLLLGGIDPRGLLGAYLVTLAVAVLGCSLSLTISVWCRKTHEVLLTNYVLWIMLLLLYPAGEMLRFLIPLSWRTGWLPLTNPFILAFAPSFYRGGDYLYQQTLAFATAMAASVALLGVAIAKVRAVTLGQDGKPNRRAPQARWTGLLQRWRRRLPGPSLDGNPVLWRERNRQSPSRWITGVWILYAAHAVFLCSFAIAQADPWTRNPGPVVMFAPYLVLTGLLLLSVFSTTTLAEERVNGTLEGLLTTPMTTRGIIWGKWFGTFLTVFWIAALPLVTVFAVSLYIRHDFLVPRYVCEWIDTLVWGRPFDRKLMWAQNSIFASIPTWSYVSLYLARLSLMAATILSSGALTTSLGLAFAAWFNRAGRAVGASVFVLVVWTIGWPVLVGFVLGYNDFSIDLQCFSPIMAIGVLSLSIVRDDPGLQIIPAIAIAMAIQAVGAVAQPPLPCFRERRLGGASPRGYRQKQQPRTGNSHEQRLRVVLTPGDLQSSNQGGICQISGRTNGRLLC